MSKTRRQPRGKNADKNYIHLGGRIPKQLKHAVKQKQDMQNIDTNTLLERLLTLWITGNVSVLNIDTTTLLAKRQEAQSELLPQEDINQEAQEARDGVATQEDIDKTAQEDILTTLATTQEADINQEAQEDPIDKQTSPHHWLDALQHQDHLDQEAQSELLAKARAHLGLNQRDMAKYLHIAQKTVSNYERGLRQAPKPVLERCLQALQEDPIDKKQEDAQEDAQARLLDVS